MTSTARTLAMTSYPTSAAAIKGVPLIWLTLATVMTGAIMVPTLQGRSFYQTRRTETLLKVVRQAILTTFWRWLGGFPQSGQLPETGHSQVKTEIPDTYWQILTHGQTNRGGLPYRYLPSANPQQALRLQELTLTQFVL